VSIDSCSKCGSYVDTDDDPECYVAQITTPVASAIELVEQNGNRRFTTFKCICESCRERLEPEEK
jgi:hypothetical protein